MLKRLLNSDAPAPRIVDRAGNHLVNTVSALLVQGVASPVQMCGEEQKCV